VSGWVSAAPRQRRLSRPLGALLLLLPFIFGAVAAPVAAPSVQGDELSQARARSARLKRDAAEQRAQIARLQRMQTGLADDIQDTAREIRGLNADSGALSKRIVKLNGQIAAVQAEYERLVGMVESLDASLIELQEQESAKKQQLAARKAQLADRIRTAYDIDRTSLLESFLSGGTFTDVLAEVSYFIDVGEQDEALADQVARDQETLAAIHQSMEDTRTQTNELRQQTAAQKRSLDRSRENLLAAKARLEELEARARAELAKQKDIFSDLSKDKAAARKALAKAQASQKRLQNRIADLVRRRSAQGRIPSVYNGSLRWPMSGTVTQNFGCTGFSWNPRVGRCSGFHRGIDIVASYGTAVRSSGAGTVVYVGWNYADGYDPAWIVVIAHSASLQTWYAHLRPIRPNGIRAGARVRAGQIVGYEGNTGRSTGAHLHWAVMYKGSFANPRLFL
jgi:murein DD-endopeptidase MepM/ murein hydrolase activator NlpD